MSTLASVFWDRVFTVTGFRRRDIERLRDSSEEEHRDPAARDVVETVELADLDWADPATVKELRAQLQGYLGVLRALKAENRVKAQSRIHVRNYIEDQRYTALRQREAAQRVTTQRVVGLFKALDLEESGIAEITADDGFAALEELRISRNELRALTFVPPNVRVLTAGANRISRIELSAPQTKLLFASLPANDLTSLAFLDSMPHLAVLDASYNCIADIADVIAALDSHPSVTDVDLRGNPVCLVEGYRRRVCSAISSLETLDGEPVTDADRQAPQRDGPDAAVYQNTATMTLTVTAVKDFPLLLATGEVDEAAAAANAAQAASVKGGKGGKAADKGKGGKGGKEEATGSAPQASNRRTVSLACSWASGKLLCPDLEAAVNAVLETEVNDGGAKAAKGAKDKDKKAAVAVPAAAPTEPAETTDTKHVVREAWEVGGEPRRLVCDLLEPCVVFLEAEDVTTKPAESQGGTSGNSPDPMNVSEVRRPFPVGYAALDFSTIGTATVPTPATGTDPVVLKATASGSIVVDPVAIAERQYSIDLLKGDLADLTAKEAQLDKELAEAKRAPTPSADELAASQSPPPKPGAKKGAPAAPAKGKASQSIAPALSEQATKLQDALTAVKAAITEQQAKIATEERALAAHQACSGVQITATCTISCRPPDSLRPPEPEVDLAATSTNPAKDQGKKKK